MRMGKTSTPGAGYRWLLSALVCLAICVSIFLCIDLWGGGRQSRFVPDAVVNLDRIDVQGQEPAPCSGSETQCLRVAIAPVVSPEKSLEAYYDLVKYLGGKVGRKTALLTGKDYSAVNNFLRLNQCDMALVCTYSFVLGERDFNMQLLAIPVIYGQRSYRSYIIVRSDSEAESLLDFRQRTFASSDVLSTSGWLYPMTWLKSKGMDLELFFGQHLITGSHDRSIQAVRSGVADGAAVDSLVFEQLAEEDPNLKDEVRIIQRSATFGMPPLVVPERLPPDLVEELREILLHMHEDAEGIKILKALSIDWFEETRPEAYESVRQLISEWEGNPLE